MDRELIKSEAIVRSASMLKYERFNEIRNICSYQKNVNTKKIMKMVDKLVEETRQDSIFIRDLARAIPSEQLADKGEG